MVPKKNQNVLQVLSWPNINKVHAFSWPLVSMNKSEFKYKSWAVPLTWKCMLFHGHWAASVSSQYHHPGWQVDLSQQAGGFILLSTQLHFNLNARLEEGPLSPDLWNGDICGRASPLTYPQQNCMTLADLWQMVSVINTPGASLGSLLGRLRDTAACVQR